MEEEANKEYRWETGYERTWEAIQENRDGLLEFSVQDIILKARRKRLAERQGKSKLGMMRHLYLVIDMSECMNNQDLKPSRLHCVLKLVEAFIEEYFYLNPISQLGIITTANKRAEKVSEMTGNPRNHLEVVKSLLSKTCVGEPSLQNCLEVVVQSLRNMPSHASREVIFIMGSLTTCDPGDINKSMAAAAESKVRCSVVNLSAEVRVYKELASLTSGLHNVILDDLHLRDCLSHHLDPPASSVSTESSLIRMGFPSHAGRGEGGGLGLCLCHLETSGAEEERRISNAGYVCPQCSAKYCELPVECRGCGLTLVSAPHLARSYHHLFPMTPFIVRPAAEMDQKLINFIPFVQDVPAGEGGEVPSQCYGCDQLLQQDRARVHKCPKCCKVGSRLLHLALNNPLARCSVLSVTS